nr:phage protein NinX family protein [Burkholderia ubonensis]
MLGGPIIERARIQIVPQSVNHLRWSAYMDEGLRPGAFPVEQYGETLLIAAMRACVASKFGEEVPDE